MALLDLSAFITKHPEFSGIDPGMVQAYLDDAAVYVKSEVDWGDYQSAGHGYMTAHLLALSPFGNGTALVAKDGTTVYEKHWSRLCRIVASGHRTI